MRRDPLFLLWAVRCTSPEDCCKLRQLLTRETAPEAVFVNEIVAFPSGAETRLRESHRVGDYFVSVTLLPAEPPSPTSFRVLFRRRPDAGRFWKDVMVRALQAARDAAPQTTAILESQGDEEPKVTASADV
jgi:hypothetical protein